MTAEDPMSEFRLSVVFYCAVNRTFQELPCSTAKIFFLSGWTRSILS